jgi:Mn-containing catalase
VSLTHSPCESFVHRRPERNLVDEPAIHAGYRKRSGRPAHIDHLAARAKIGYERLINVTDDPGIKEALGFLMTREIAHQKSFEKALHSIQPNFPQGKLPGVPEFTSVYYNMSQGEDARGPWNSGGDWEFIEDPQPAVGGGDGLATVTVSGADVEVLQAMAARTASDTGADPKTGADLGSGQAV